MSKVSVQVPPNVHPRQIDDFASDVKRSKPGALYFVPGAMKVITQDEYEHLKKKHKRFAEMLIVKPYKRGKKEVELAAKAAEEAKSKPVKSTPKDKVSRAKQRAAEILKKKREVAPAPTPEPQSDPKPEPEATESVVPSYDFSADETQSAEGNGKPHFKKKKKKH